ncbi:MAG: hypothetical protein ABL920_04205 [Methylotenera sp.]
MKNNVLFLVVASLFTSQAYAAETFSTHYLAMLSSNEMQTAFQQDAQPLQVASLSKQEMQETEGAVVFVPILIALATGASLGTASYAAGNGLTTLSNTGLNNFNTNYSNNWNTNQAVFSAGVGAVTGGLGSLALRAAGVTSQSAGIVQNLTNTFTTAEGLAIKGNLAAKGAVANYAYAAATVPVPSGGAAYSTTSESDLRMYQWIQQYDPSYGSMSVYLHDQGACRTTSYMAGGMETIAVECSRL